MPLFCAQLDVELHGDFANCASRDSIGDALDYTKVYDVVKEVVERRSYKLLEALAGAVASELISRFVIDKVIVRVRKPNVPFSASLSNVEVELERNGNK